MKSLLPAFALSLLALAPTVASAYDEPDRCYTTSDPRCSDVSCGNTFYNPSVTQNWLQTRQAADPSVMRSMAGVYYSQYPDPGGRMVEQVYRSYEADGLWQYQDQTCTVGSQIPCSQNQGAGNWAAYALNDGSIFLMVHFSDLSRSNNCFSQTLRLSNRGFTDSLGGVWQRVR